MDQAGAEILTSKTNFAWFTGPGRRMVDVVDVQQQVEGAGAQIAPAPRGRPGRPLTESTAPDGNRAEPA